MACMSDGCRTLDFSATGTDDEDTQANLHYYGGPVSARTSTTSVFRTSWRPRNTIRASCRPGQPAYHHPATSTNPATPIYIRTNLSPGTDYAISVQEFKADFKGDLDQRRHLQVAGECLRHRKGRRSAGQPPDALRLLHVFRPSTTPSNFSTSAM